MACWLGGGGWMGVAGQAGVWRLTYADEDLRVLFAAGMTNQGKPARTENIYILKRA